MNECYLCGIQLESLIDETTSNHEEHIIPQAIGGQLTVKGILCKECGGEKYLGGQIDKPFSNMFLLITLKIRGRVEIEGLSPKDVSIYMSELGMSYDDISDKSDEEARKTVGNVFNSRNRYVFEIRMRMIFTSTYSDRDIVEVMAFTL